MNTTATLSALEAMIPWRDRLAARLILGRLRQLRSGGVRLTLPDGAHLHLGNPEAPRQVALRVHDWRFFRRALANADIGAGESYMDGDWQCSDLVDLCRMLVEDRRPLELTPPWSWLARAAAAVARLGRANTLAGSRRNIAHHYDLGNEFYRLFLDDALMMYSAAVFPSPDASLEEAQRAKVDGICRRLGLRRDMRVLEIGSGWGGFAVHAAREYGCRVTSITLSARQLELARERAREAGVEDRIEFLLCDYRRVEGIYDRIVSIEMFEAVGLEYYGAFFAACDRVLAPGGRVFLQTITVPDQRFDSYRRESDFMRRHIFPGGLLASVAAIVRALERRTALRIEWMEDIGAHYAPTLAGWRRRFLAHLDDVRGLGFDERFIRMWEFYLASCEALFAARYLGDAQIVLARPLEGALDSGTGSAS